MGSPYQGRRGQRPHDGHAICGVPLARPQAPVADLAAKNRLPSIYGIRENVEAGGLVHYGPDLLDQARRAGAYVDKILKGAKPADLPVE
jgi:hypothetical protein